MMRGFSRCRWECCIVTRSCCGCCNKKSAPNYGGANLQVGEYRSDNGLLCTIHLERWLAEFRGDGGGIIVESFQCPQHLMALPLHRDTRLRGFAA
jgi:hypothetical protein